MSGLIDPEISAEIAIFHRIHPGSSAFVHGISVVNLWPIPGRCQGTDLRIW